jgi:hypothetical protein
VTCPGCGQDVIPKPVAFTAWGGVIGPKLLSHVECPRCQARFNGKTGLSNDQAIRIYVFCAVVLAIAFCLFLFLQMG